MADADYDFVGGYDHQEREPGPGPASGVVRRYVNLAGALTSVALMVGAGIWAYDLAMRDVRGVPVIQAQDGPMRVAPDDPGGEVVDYQGLAVNEVAAVGAAAPLPDRLVLAPRPVELTDEDVSGLAGLATGAGIDLAPAAAVMGGAVPELAADPQGESASPTEVAIDAALAEALGEIPGEMTDPVEGGDPALDPDLAMEALPEGAITLSLRPKARPGSAAAEAVAETTETAEPQGDVTILAREVDPTTIAVGTRLVQFGAFDTADAARAEWARLEARFGEVMTGKDLVLQPAESGGRTFIRLRAHGFSDEDDARRFCSAFVAEGLVCIPVPQR